MAGGVGQDDEWFPRRGELYWIDFDPARGNEQAGHRPGCVISTDLYNRLFGVVTIAAVTTKVKEGSGLCVTLPEGEPSDERSQILPFQVVAVTKSRLEGYIGRLTPDQLTELDDKLRLCWGL
jgi:mRNA interferase MazF